jgi:hypothetical protein
MDSTSLGLGCGGDIGSLWDTVSDVAPLAVGVSVGVATANPVAGVAAYQGTSAAVSAVNGGGPGAPPPPPGGSGVKKKVKAPPPPPPKKKISIKQARENKKRQIALRGGQQTPAKPADDGLGTGTMVAIGVGVLAVGGGAAWWFLRK